MKLNDVNLDEIYKKNVDIEKKIEDEEMEINNWKETKLSSATISDAWSHGCV